MLLRCRIKSKHGADFDSTTDAQAAQRALNVSKIAHLKVQQALTRAKTAGLGYPIERINLDEEAFLRRRNLSAEGEC